MHSLSTEQIPLAAPRLGAREWEYVKQCLDTGWVSYSGKYVYEFERVLAKRVRAKDAISTVSGTAALHLAYILAGVDRDDEVVMPALSFVAPANAARYLGAWPTFVDVTLHSWQWDVDQLADFLRHKCERISGKLVNRATQRRIGAVCAVHLLGGMADLDAIVSLCNEFSLPLVEDAAECLGATYKGREIAEKPPALGETPRIVITSFNANKIITTGGGGAILVNDRAIAQRARHLSTTAKTDPIEFNHDDVGYNYRISNVAAAIGLAQLEQLPEYLAAKRAIAHAYDEALSGYEEIAPMPRAPDVAPTHWLYTIRVDAGARPLIAYLLQRNIQVRPLWRPLTSLPFLAKCHVVGADRAGDLHNHCVSLPCGAGLSAAQSATVISAIVDYFH